jgi:PIN domain nuclease of toxin-antitoxin system
MKVLLDTHAFLWLITDDNRLSQTARRAFLNPKNSLFFSAASLWEICVKKSLGKLSLRNGWLQTIQNELKVNAIQWLPIEIAHCTRLSRLPFHHRDPFDRMLIAQTLVENLRLLSRDDRFAAYKIICIC